MQGMSWLMTSLKDYQLVVESELEEREAEYQAYEAEHEAGSEEDRH